MQLLFHVGHSTPLLVFAESSHEAQPSTRHRQARATVVLAGRLRWGASLIEGASEYFTLEPGGLAQEIDGVPPGSSQPKDLTHTTIFSPTVAQVAEIGLDWF